MIFYRMKNSHHFLSSFVFVRLSTHFVPSLNYHLRINFHSLLWVSNYTTILSDKTSKLVSGVKPWSMYPIHKTFSGLWDSEPSSEWAFNQGCPVLWVHVTFIRYIWHPLLWASGSSPDLTSHLLFKGVTLGFTH